MRSDRNAKFEGVHKRIDDFRLVVDSRLDDLNRRLDDFQSHIALRFEDFSKRQDETNRRLNNLQTTTIIGWITILGAVIGLSFT